MTSYRDPYWQPEPGTPRWAIVVAGLILVAGIAASCVIYFSREETDSKAVAARTQSTPYTQTRVQQQPQVQPPTQPSQPATREPRQSDGDILGPGAEASFEALAASLSARVGLAVAPLAGGTVHEFGDLREGHAWSSIKVPIVTTLLREQGEALDSEEEAWAASAITASDNEAAAALFGRLEDLDGGLEGASRAVEATLAAAGDTTTVVSTAPPPAGAVSTYGQTDWSLNASVQFYGSLVDRCLLGPAGTEYVEGLMEEVIPEQRWGLGEAGFPAGWSVGMKGGWGPEASAGGAYLVRQSGFVREGDRGIAVAMIAMDETGTYPAGAEDLTQIAQWLAGELRGLGPQASGCTG